MILKTPEFWYPKQKRISWISYLLWPLSMLYGGVIFLRHACYRIFGLSHRPTPQNVPIIIVGNITVGGTGKTPLVLWLADFLRQQGFKPGIVSRGYMRNNKTMSDEVLLISERTHCPIEVNASRVLAVSQLLASTNCNVIISDDGLQHYALKRDIEIAAIDGTRKFGNGFLLPAGPLREPKKRLKEVDFIITTDGQKEKSPNAYAMNLHPSYFYNLTNPERHQSKKYFTNKTVHAVAGIGNPQRFFDTLCELGLKIIEHPFPDHYSFTAKDLDFGDHEIIVMTEKDAMKCRNFADQNCWALRVDAEIESGFEEALKKKNSEFRSENSEVMRPAAIILCLGHRKND